MRAPTTWGAFHHMGFLIRHNTCRVCILFPARPSPSLLSRCLTRGNQNAFVKTHRSACNFTSTVTHFSLATSAVRHFLLYYSICSSEQSSRDDGHTSADGSGSSDSHLICLKNVISVCDDIETLKSPQNRRDCNIPHLWRLKTMKSNLFSTLYHIKYTYK